MPDENRTTACPSCLGGKRRALFDVCMWCQGAKIVKKATALKYANWCDILAEGGYIDGTHNYEDMQRMRAEAKAVRETCNHVR